MTDPDTPMKSVKPQSTAGSANQIPSLVPGTGEDFDKTVAAYKQRMKAHTDAIKKHLEKFIEKTHPADWSCVTTALLELGIERRLDLHGEDDTKDLMERTFSRVLKGRRGPLQ